MKSKIQPYQKREHYEKCKAIFDSNDYQAAIDIIKSKLNDPAYLNDSLNIYYDVAEIELTKWIDFQLKHINDTNLQNDIYMPPMNLPIDGLPCNATSVNINTYNGDYRFLEKLNMVITGATAIDGGYHVQCTGHEPFKAPGGYHYKRDELKGARYSFAQIILKDYPDMSNWQPEQVQPTIIEPEAITVRAIPVFIDKRGNPAARKAFAYARTYGLKAEIVSTMIFITGKTFYHKKNLKEIGCQFNRDKRAWYATTAN